MEETIIAKLLKSNDRSYFGMDLRVIGSTGEQLGIMRFADACNVAREAGLDLVLVSENSVPPVCRIQDFGKLIFEQKKKEKEQDKKARAQKQKKKQTKFTVRIDAHDYETKISRSKEFLQEGDELLVSIVFRGREAAHLEMGEELMKKITEDLADCGVPKGEPEKLGKNLNLTFNPKSNH